jgi:ubiquinone/menaquinone biosynthesis C-methylase UbiE
VDINQEMLDEAKKNFSEYKNVSYVCNSFEDAKFPKKTFDLIFTAQSWHWINPKIGYVKVIRLLKDDGVFAVIWKLQDDKSTVVRGMEKIYKRYYKNYSRHGNKKRKSPEHVINEVSKIKELRILAVKKYKAKINYTRDELIGLTGTYSWVAGLRNKELLFRALHDLLKKRREPIAIPYNYDLIMIGKASR